MKNTKKIVSVIIFSLFLISPSCSSDDKENDLTTFDTKQMISDITTGIILPSISIFNEHSLLFEKSIQDFVVDPSEEKLVIAQNNWKETARLYANIYSFNIGRPKELFMHQLLFNWPTFTEAIDNSISSTAEINIDTISTRAKGLTGIEYLLFVDNTISNEEILSLFSTNPKRFEYLALIVGDFKNQAQQLSEIWNGSEENYNEVFVTNQETGLKSSLNILYNGLFNVAETIKKAKLGKPAGLESSSATNPRVLQAFRSEISTDLIRNNIKSIENTYFNSSGLGISDNVQFITKNNQINDRIKDQFELIYESLDKVTMPLHIAIDQQKQPVEESYNRIKELVIFLNNDVGSALSIIITPTDNDGD